ncbi:Disease resistance protein RML1B [Glycine soja]|uniref:ADP-ribosyl cyclase/cyclic ADP-ribose hydrolase n=1 Tax=Glycine soja TaxID=3848 RepID=A0A445KEP8_GLYSO|nr:Disease resistance protein RML1B [Glycine soja]
MVIWLGWNSCVEELEKCLALESVSDVRVVGISGMKGIGKTTLARALYEKIADRYDFHCFVDDLNKIYQLSGSLGGIETLLCECLGEGSKIIIISRNEHILMTHGVHHVYQVQPLNQDNVVQLFCKNAFRCDYIMSGYEMLTHDVLSHAQGHPLTIEVMGKSLVGRNVSQWKSALVRLSEIKSKDIMDVLRTSYDDLEEKDNEIFLDIACFFGQDSEDYVKEILDFRGFYPEIGLQILVEKSLITISHGVIHMHSLLRDLGKCIVREKSPKEPRKWSRLWDCENLYKVMSDNMCLPCLRRVDLSYSKNLIKMPNFGEALNLERLNLEGCIQLKHIGSSISHLRKLTSVILENCKGLVKLPNFGEGHILQCLNLGGCIQLSHINPSIGLLKKLTFLNLKDCKSLVSLPNYILSLSSLECLNLSGCSKLNNIGPLHSIHCWFPPCMRQCDISFCNLLQIHDAIGDLPCLETLNVSGNNFATLPNLKELRRLFHLNLQHCKKLKDLPELPLRVDLLSKAYMPPWPVIEPLPWGRVAGLYIFNCPKLVEREHCARKTISWMIKVIQECHQYKLLEFHLVVPRIEVIIPGSEIPSWFNNRHEGSLISIDPSSIVQRDNNCIGVVCCAVFSAGHQRRNFSVMSPPKTNGVFPANVPVVLEGDLITDNLDHLGLFFFTLAQFFKTCSWNTPNPGDVKWEFEIRDQKGFDVKVKNCGYRWVYEKDLHPSQLTMMHTEC